MKGAAVAHASNALVSVIVPVYNAAQFLDQALASLEAQTHESLEILCVNDGSTDASPEILARHAAADERIRLIDKPNGGYGSACNQGMAEATGEWIAILEPDDWVEPGMYADMLAFAEGLHASAPIDIIKTPYWVIRNPDTPQQMKLNCSYRGRIRPKSQPFAAASEPHLFAHHPSIWSAIYRREFLNEFGIRFLEIPGAGWADNPFLVETLCQARNIAYLPQAYYCYREETPEKTRATAIANPCLSFERWQDMADVLDRIDEKSRAVWMQQVTRGFTNMATVLRYVDPAQKPELLAAMHAMYDRMPADLVFENPRVTPALKRDFAEYRGIENPPISQTQYYASLIGEGIYNVWNKGPKATFAMLKGFLSKK